MSKKLKKIDLRKVVPTYKQKRLLINIENSEKGFTYYKKTPKEILTRVFHYNSNDLLKSESDQEVTHYVCRRRN